MRKPSPQALVAFYAAVVAFCCLFWIGVARMFLS